MHVGITGSRHNLPGSQIESLYRVLTDLAYRDGNIHDSGIVLHHGCCTGADESAHKLMSIIPGVAIIGHPGKDARGNSPYLMDMTSFVGKLYPRKLYADRNHDIVNACELLIACPAYPENDKRSTRSGTWQTIRMARNTNCIIAYISPNGSVTCNQKCDRDCPAYPYCKCPCNHGF